MFDWLFGKKDVKKVEEETKKSFNRTRDDISNINKWIKLLNYEKDSQKKEIKEIKESLSTVKQDVEELKNIISVMGNLRPEGGFRMSKRLSNKHTAVEVVQTAVQTAVQTPNLDQFSMTERALLWVLLNTELKLSYEDLAAVLGKEKSTIRSQINAIKQKSEIVEEVIEKNGKKRVYIPDKIKDIMLKKSKVRVKMTKNHSKNED